MISDLQVSGAVLVGAVLVSVGDLQRPVHLHILEHQQPASQLRPRLQQRRADVALT